MEWKDFIPVGNGKSETFPVNPSVSDYISYLRNHTNDLYSVCRDFDRIRNDLSDYADMETLRREGYFHDPRGRMFVHPGGSAKFFPGSNIVSLPIKEVGGKYACKRSTVAHEVGHYLDLIRRDGDANTLDIFNDAYPNYYSPTDMLNSSIHSITNGLDKTDRIKAEENAWDCASGRYDPKDRAGALATYYTEAADSWRRSALERIVNENGLSMSEENKKSKIPPEIRYPEISDFWRTNSYPSAIKYLKSLKPIRK